MTTDALPPVPSVQSLSSAQQRGTACVWCSVPLTPAIAADLGPRKIDAHGSTVLWFPRSCRNCRKDHP
ncbi:hypothetical protein [Streptomyces brevispora]|uniref:hypothetical protein n=1 Tax=Streptomyces brevispora TaxID=887462 RepID=UPI0035D751C2